MIRGSYRHWRNVCAKREDCSNSIRPTRTATIPTWRRFHRSRFAAKPRIEEAFSRLGEWQVLQFRRELVRPLELVLCLRVLAFLAQRQGEIVVRFGVAWLKPRRFCKLRLCPVDIPGLQQYKPEVIVALGKFRVLSHEIAKDIGCGGGIVVLAQSQPELHSRIEIVRIKADSLRSLCGLRLTGMEAFATNDLSLCFFSIRQFNE